MAQFDFSAWSDFLNEVRRAEDALDNPSIVWYRGVNDARFDLRPSLLRRVNGLEKEGVLFEKYKLLATLFHQNRHSDWEILYDMQHYRIPTRLLDWTEVLGIAVFFALLGNGDADAAIFVLNPLALNSKAAKSEIPLVHDDPNFEYRRIYLENRPMPAVQPLAVHAPAQNNRILAQRSKFTVHGSDQRSIEEQFPSAVRKVRLQRRMKEGAREYLRISGIDEFSVFPDLSGLAPFLEEVVGIRS